MPPHPAKFTPTILSHVRAILNMEQSARGSSQPLKILDPFAGVGRIHNLNHHDTYGIEIEPEWANTHPRTIVGNALALPFPDDTFDAVISSPTYANRLADNFEPKDGSKRINYRQYLGRKPHPESSATMQWGKRYQSFHVDAWAESARTVKPGGLMIINISNHVRNHKIVKVTEWTIGVLAEHGLIEMVVPVETPRMGFGANSSARANYESIVVTRVD